MAFDPFEDPQYPSAAFTNQSPRRYGANNGIGEESEEEEFMAFPVSQSPGRGGGGGGGRSPDIFTRSGRNSNLNDILGNAPKLAPGPSLDPSPGPRSRGPGSPGPGSPNRTSPGPGTPGPGSPSRASPGTGVTARAQFTSRESPQRQRQVSIDQDDSNDSIELGSPRSQYGRSIGSGRSDRILEPPQPIFSPETYAEANPFEEPGPGSRAEESGREDDSGEESDDTLGSYNYSGYQKAADEQSVFSGSTAGPGSGSSGYGSGSASGSGYGASLDSLMKPRPNYTPNANPSTHRRKVRLVDGNSGNLVLENPIPSELRKVLTRTESPFGEFTNMTYTACTSEPDQFIADGFTLRPSKFGRDTEIVIGITMYNEDEYAFARTMHSVMKNIAHLCTRNKSSCWGKESWKKVQVVIIADGRSKVNENVLQLLTATGCYQGNLARPYVNNKKVNAHIFEYTTQISIDENLKFKGDEKSLAPVQVMFCLKEKNLKKINSHRWLFNAFCPILDPNVVVLLDVGTKPDNQSIYNLWKAFDRDSNVAGAAGEIKAIKGRGWVNLTNPLVALQNFEYKMSNILDKPLESLFGYISVLPGALSAYRYIALKDHDDGTGPLALYFRGEDLLNDKGNANSKTNFFEANMYLAEDRILCWELVAKRNENWVLKFVKLATAETDVPENVAEFLSQRRRWINGAFFAALYSLRNFSQIWQTDHSFARKFWLHVEFLYQMVTLIVSFFSLSNFYLTFYFLTGSLITIFESGGFWIFTIFNYLCICVLTSLFIVSIGNRPHGSRTIFKTLICLLTVCALYALIVGVFFVSTAIQNYGTDNGTSLYIFISVVVSILATYGLYAFMSLLYLDPWHMITCSIQYFLMIPSYTCTLQIFAFCNTHDVSWGTKGDNNPTEDRTNRYIIEKNEEGEFEAVVLDVNIDEIYLETLYNIRAKRSNKKVHKDVLKPVEVSGEDYAKDVRTKVVLIWLLCNLVFIMTMLQVYEAGDTETNIYLGVILWMVATLAFVRAVGSTGYLVQTYARFIVETKSKWLHKKRGYVAPSAHSFNKRN